MNRELKRTLECLGINTVFVIAAMTIYILLVVAGVADGN